jgi:hypothetical protein
MNSFFLKKTIVLAGKRHCSLVRLAPAANEMLEKRAQFQSPHNLLNAISRRLTPFSVMGAFDRVIVPIKSP